MRWVTRVELENGDDKLIVGSGSTERCELESCQVDLKEQSSTFSFSIRSLDNSLIDRFPPRKTLVRIYQGLENEEQHLITGFIDSPPFRYSNKIYQYTFDGVDYTAKTQDILVNESYENERIDFIITDLINEYMPGTEIDIETCDISISIKFKNKYLYDCLESISKAIGWNFKIDKNLVFKFWNPQQKTNDNILTIKNCKPSFNFKPDISNLVTRLRVEGAKRLSGDQTILFKGDGETKVFQIPGKNIRVSSSGNIQVFLNDLVVNLGIKNIHEFSDTINFLYDSSSYTIESNIPLTAEDTLKVIYSYEYPVFFTLEDLDAQDEYGIIDRTYTPNATDEEYIKQEANDYLAKYKKPIYSGSIEPHFGYYEPGELVKINLPKLKIDDYLKITSVQYSGTRIQNIKLNIEETLTDVDLIKSIIKRIQELEGSNTQDGPVEKISIVNDSFRIVDEIQTYIPQLLRCGTGIYVTDNPTVQKTFINQNDVFNVTDEISMNLYDFNRTGDIYLGNLDKMKRDYVTYNEDIVTEGTVEFISNSFKYCGDVYIGSLDEMAREYNIYEDSVIDTDSIETYVNTFAFCGMINVGEEVFNS